MKVMFCSVTNTSIRNCNVALSALYTISELINAEVRRQLEVFCRSPSENDTNKLDQGMQVYNRTD